MLKKISFIVAILLLCIVVIFASITDSNKKEKNQTSDSSIGLSLEANEPENTKVQEKEGEIKIIDKSVPVEEENVNEDMANCGAQHADIVQKPIIEEEIVQEKDYSLCEYPTAEYAWDYLINYGYSEYVAAGILGNMMAETGGQTLNIHWDMHTSCYYGLCAWGLRWYPDVEYLSLEDQMVFLTDTIEYQFDYCGHMFGYEYEDFLKIKNPRTAAAVFMRVYERCSENSIYARKDNAEFALKYFTTK